MMTMRVLFGLLVYILSCGTLQGIQDYEITYPERLHSRRHRRDLSTAIDGGHEHSVKFAIKAFQNNWVLDANINERVTPQTVLLRQFDADDSEIITKESPDTCHYQGSIRGIPESVVALTTCNGLSGVIDDGVETYHIEPHANYKDTGAHKIYPAKRRKGFDVSEEPDFDKKKIYGNDESLVTQQINRVRRNVANVEDQYKPYLTTNETRYNEVFFVVDHGIYKRFGKNIKTTVERLITLCNILDAIYQRINIRVVMSALEIWTNGPRFRRRFGDFKLFGDYLNEEIRGRVHFDNAHFLSHYSWRGANGLGWIGAMCGSGSYAINSWSHAWGSLIGPYIVVAHEMGHNFNFPHYSAKCKCLSSKGCVMQYYPNPRMLGFSDCSLNALKRINDRCLYNVPTLAINSKCGNGIREGNEECDCGTPEMCKAKDPCCMPHDCRLKPGALCSDQHHTCCKDCLFKRQGTLCRPVKTDCDVPEYCPGDSRDCPADISLQDGTPCNTANKSYCFTGKCAETRNEQCRDLWGPRSASANQACYDKLNTEANGYGTCDATSNSPCATADVLCGQIQCSTNNKRPVVDYGKSYKKMTLNGSSAARCSAAVLKKSDMVGQGMVNDGTKCGDQKMCMNSKCKSFKKLNITKCPSVNGIECNGRGRCTSLGTCHCHSGYDPNTACEKVLLPIDGGFTTWTNWSICTKGCDTGKQSRYRFCNNPAPQHGGKDCQGEKTQEQQCNKVPCPKAHSCRHLQLQAISNNLDLPDAIYKIYPQGLSRKPILAYCDMSRDGGGWTLLVTSRTNTWNAKNIMLRNIMSPSLTQDYSILKYADDIKNNINVSGTTFEYRLEAQARGRWGGIWQADRSYTFTATTNTQTNVKLIKKFDNWDYSDNGIEKRMPWIKFAKRLHFAILTTSRDAYSKFWGTIAAPFKGFHPAPWIYGHLTESNPDVIWYWMREGPWQFPR